MSVCKLVHRCLSASVPIDCIRALQVLQAWPKEDSAYAWSETTVPAAVQAAAKRIFAPSSTLSTHSKYAVHLQTEAQLAQVQLCRLTNRDSMHCHLLLDYRMLPCL